MPQSISKLVAMLPPLVAILTFVLIVIRAVTTVDPYWDTLAYHWAYAARAAGICDQACFSMPSGLEDRYAGFPMIYHWLAGTLWRITGSPATSDVIGIVMLAVVCVYLRTRFRVPLHWSWLAFLAIPEVQIQLTSSYVDVPLNAAVVLGLLVLLYLSVVRPVGARIDVAVALVALALAAGSKFQLVPIAMIVWLAIVVVVARTPEVVGFHSSTTAYAWLLAVGAVFLMPKLALNTLEFGNPFYPIAVAIGPIRFPGPEALAQSTSISDVWASRPGPLRWLASVLEFDAFRGRELPWTLGQGEVPQSSPSFRMGGYFGSYVLALLALLLWCARTSPIARLPAYGFLALSVLCAFLPLSHELRYYLFWMLSLVALVLVSAFSPAFKCSAQYTQRQVSCAVVGVAVASVVMMTGAEYVRPRGASLASLLDRTNAVTSSVSDADLVCVINRDRTAFLYSIAFHPQRHYRTLSVDGDGPADCTIRIDPSRNELK